jgi:hypothetical protein
MERQENELSPLVRDVGVGYSRSSLFDLRCLALRGLDRFYGCQRKWKNGLHALLPEGLPS